MTMNKTNISTVPRKQFPVSLGIAAGYLLLIGTLVLVFPFLEILGIGSQYPAFQAKSIAYKAGAYSRELIFSILFLISGVGLFLRNHGLANLR
jgi:hypothetical protein